MTEISNINFPENSTNVIVHLADKTRVVFASLEIRNKLAEAISKDIEVEFEFDHTKKFIRIGDTTYSSSTRELETNSWLFFNIRPQS